MAECGSSECFVNIKVKKNGQVYSAKIDPSLAAMLNLPDCDQAVKQSIIDEVVRQNTVQKQYTVQEQYNIQEPDDENNNCRDEINSSQDENNNCRNENNSCQDENDNCQDKNEMKDTKAPKLWNTEEEKMLIHIRLAQDLAFNSAKSHEVLWNNITKELNSNGINVSKVQVINKWKALKKKYKEIIDSNKKTGNERVDWKYFDFFHEAYGHKASTAPAFTMDTSKKCTKYDQDETEMKTTQTSGKKRKSNASDKVIKVIKESNEKLIDQINSQHDAKMTRMDRFLNIFEKSVLAKKD